MLVVEALERPELVRASDAPSELLRVDDAEVGVVATSLVELVTTPLGGLAFGGTSWTCRLSGWLDFAGGGRTKINVWRMVSVNGKKDKNRIMGGEQARGEDYLSHVWATSGDAVVGMMTAKCGPASGVIPFSPLVHSSPNYAT